MSYDLAVFDMDAAPRERAPFLAWYDTQTEWNEEHAYDDPAVSSAPLRAWFLDIIAAFPPMNGPLAADDNDGEPGRVTDYSVGRSLIYAAFAWPQAQDAHATVFGLAAKHGVGFFDASSELGEVWWPDGQGALTLAHAD
ncbi:hypothetical protein [Xanthomonas tesorieronis]|uniref:hypothetical protein n=1 Tax=Xanthomonas tesorieronis TaxID=3160839 RepID=UPI00351394DC